VSGSWLPWLPLLVALISVAGGALLYNYRKGIDRADQILAERRRLYRDFVVTAQKYRFKIWNSDFAEFANWYVDYKSVFGELMVTAPDHVVEALFEFDRIATQVLKTNKKTDADGFDKVFHSFTKNYLTVVDRMRKDTFGDTSLSVEKRIADHTLEDFANWRKKA
jgi:hypothetical protein